MCSCSLALPALFDQYLSKGFGFIYYFTKLSTYFASSSKDQSSTVDDTKRLNNSQPWGQKDMYRKVETQKGAAHPYSEPYYGSEMSARGDDNSTSNGNGNAWPQNSILGTVELHHLDPLNNQSPV
jgi:hypothetical protein